MADLLSSPMVWLGLGVVLLIAFFWPSGGMGRKKKQARLARVAQRKISTIQRSAQSLRRKAPGSDTAIGQILASMRSISKLQGRLEVAGITQTSPQKFLQIMLGIAVGSTFVLFIFTGKSFIICLLMGILLGIALPHLYVSRRIHKRQLAFLKLFPDAIDLMVRGLRAGLPIGESFINTSKEIPPPVGDLFANISQMTQLGMPMEKALIEAGTKLNLTEFNFFVTTVILQRETGGNLGEILSNLSDMLRQRHMMKLKIGALSSEARASAYIIGSLPFVVFTLLQIVSPDYLSPLFNDARGNKALMYAGLMMATGAYSMKRMTQFEI